MQIEPINIIGIISTLFGIIVSIYCSIKTKKTKKLAANSESTILISETIGKYENLKISCNNEDIKSLTSTVVRIKNIGSDIVEPSDLAPSSPIIIKTTQKFLLNDVSQYKIMASNSKNVVKLTKIDDSSLQISFDFLNPKDEICVTILHTGDISVNGGLKTSPIRNYTRKKYENNEPRHSRYDDLPSTLNFPYMFFTLIMGLFALTILFVSITSNELSYDRMILCAILMFMTISPLSKNRR